MWSSFTAEVLKLRKRTATWVLLLILILVVVLSGYISTYGFLLGPNDPSGKSGDTRTVGDLNPEVFAALLPKKVLVNTLLAVSQFGGSVVALIFGSLAFGSEYDWGTLKTTLSRKPGKLKVFVGKSLAMLAYFALFSAVALLVGGICSYAIASIEEMTIAWPAAWSIFRAFGACWLMLGAGGALGVFLATAFRSSAIAIGIGLGYAIILESIVGSLPTNGADLQPLFASLLGKNSGDLARSFGDLPEYFFPLTAGDPVRASQAAIVLGAYIVILSLLSIFTFWQRDVT